ADEVDGLRILRDEAPLHAGREARAATAAQVRRLDLVGDEVGLDLQRLAGDRVAAGGLVAGHGARAVIAEALGDELGREIGWHHTTSLSGCGSRRISSM